MLKYYLAAAALKIFSANPFTQNAYNSLSSLKRKTLPRDTALEPKYINRTHGFLEIAHRYGFIRDGIDVFELGTGWIHWEALVVRNEGNCKAVLYDVVDKRDLGKFKRVISALSSLELRRRLGFRSDELVTTLTALEEVRDFESIYRKLGFSYVLDETGRLDSIENEKFDLVVSSDVFEHLPAANITHILRRLREIMKPDGWAYHQIVLQDHLRIYANNVHPKQYLTYENSYWERFLSNKVQYINRVQLPQWRSMIRDAGLEIVEEVRSEVSDLRDLKVSRDFAEVPREDLACGVVQFVLRHAGQLETKSPK